jgi:hypothetical protein
VDFFNSLLGTPTGGSSTITSVLFFIAALFGGYDNLANHATVEES